MTTYIKNPPLNPSTMLPRANGQVRTTFGQLEYLNPQTGTYVPAVRLQSIRLRIIQDSLLQGNGKGYRYPKSDGNILGVNPKDYTSFVLRDQRYGEDRACRNPVLFVLKPTGTGQKPIAYVMLYGCIVLDSFDHGIRDFGAVLPLCLSSHLDGRDIETYTRRNKEITYYDLIARMPNGYYTGVEGQIFHSGPPRVGTISMRATRFRLKAGCLAWNEKGDTAAKNRKMLSFMPDRCEIENSTRPFRDLTKQERDECETAKGKRGNKRRKIDA